MKRHGPLRFSAVVPQASCAEIRLRSVILSVLISGVLSGGVVAAKTVRLSGTVFTVGAVETAICSHPRCAHGIVLEA